MEIKTWLFFSFWVMISLLFLKLGFNAVDRTELSKSVPPVMMFIFKHTLAICICHSSDHTFVHFRQIKIQEDRYHKLVGIYLLPPLMYSFLGLPLIYYFPLHGFALFCEIAGKPFFSAISGDGIGLSVDFLLKLSLLAFGHSRKFIPVFVLLISCYTSDVRAAAYEEERMYELLPVSTSNLKKKNGKMIQFGVGIMNKVLLKRDDDDQSMWFRILSKRRKLIEFAIGMVGTILFQNFFKLTTFDHVLAFLYFALSWLGNLALFRGSQGDFGVLNFLLGNVIVGCAVSQFGLQWKTWTAFGASVLLYGLRLKLEALIVVDRIEKDERVIVW